MRKIGFFLGMAFLLCLPAAAQESSKADAFLGYSYVRANPPGHVRGTELQPQRWQRLSGLLPVPFAGYRGRLRRLPR